MMTKKTIQPFKQSTISSFLLILFVAVGSAALAHPAHQKIVTVAANGTADFTTIQSAINSLPDSATEDRIIFITNGIYTEKIFIAKSHIVLIGQDKRLTIITQSISRDQWKCNQPDDYGTATINLKGNNITLMNLTITNRFGFDWQQDIIINCPADTANPQKTITKNGHQMVLRSFETTQLKVINCVLSAFGGDTVSPWNTENGMFYFKDCVMEGSVDLYCPRGWAYAENCVFYAYRGDAILWHDGSKYQDSKTVLNHCTFSGYEGFNLGRYHRDAQFYLLNCSFATGMANQPIFLVKTNNIIQWGQRVYYYNCHRPGGDYSFYANNLFEAALPPNPASTTPFFVFGKRWMPEAELESLLNQVATLYPKMETAKPLFATDSLAENMLAYQRSVGGWPKAIGNEKVDYHKKLGIAERQAIVEDSTRNDATIDNNATTKEIRYLVKAFKQTHNPTYLTAAEKGIRYLLQAQHINGGWPQFYPDSSSYRNQITYNDDAMINAMNLLQDVVEAKNDWDVVDKMLIAKANAAIEKGVDCILKTQVVANGKRTVWCAQHNDKTLLPAKARSFELISNSGCESVSIVRFLMRLSHPSAPIKQSIEAAVDWFNLVAIKGYQYVQVPQPNTPKGFDMQLQPNAESVVWARFYDIENNRPFFSGRDGQKKLDVQEIEYERRTGYAWYGNWPAKLLTTDYENWKAKNGNK